MNFVNIIEKNGKKSKKLWFFSNFKNLSIWQMKHSKREIQSEIISQPNIVKMHAIRHWKYQILNFWPKNFTGSKSGNLILYWRKCENPSFFVYFWENWGNLSIENFVSTFTSQIFRHDTAWGLPFQTHYRMWNYHMEFMNKKCFELWNIIEKKR